MSADRTGPCGSEFNAVLGPGSEARWYCLSRDGLATLCADEEDAKEVAAESWVLYPNNGPYRVAQMVDAAAVAKAVATERERIAQWLEGQGQPGYAHEVRHRA